MKNFTIVVILIFTAISFAQKPTNSILNQTKLSKDFILSNSSKLSLNMKPFKLEDFIQHTDPLNEFQKKYDIKRIKSGGRMPIFEPKGKFYIENIPVEENIDFKLKIFDLEKSKYGQRNLG